MRAPRVPERRAVGIRRDLNDLVRDESGRVSLTKIGGMIGQWLAVKLILENGAVLITQWDSLTVLFSVLMAPGMLFKFVNMKYGGNGAETTTTTDTDTQSQSRAVEKRTPKR